MTDTVNTSIVIPCYRSTAWLPELVRRIRAVMGERDETYEVLLVHDGSGAETWEVIRRLATEHGEVRGIDLLFNTGQYRATLCGLEQARGDVVVTMDDDLQHRPEDLPQLLDALRDDPELDCVMGRFAVKRHSWFRRLASGVVHRMYIWLYGKPRDLAPSSFRAMTRTLVDAVCAHGTVNPAPGPLIYRTTARIANVDVTHEARPGGGSSYTLLGLIGILLDSFFNATTLPLRLVSVTGLLAAAASFGLGAYYLLRGLAGGYGVPGFATQVVLITFFGGMTLFSIGLVGEYMLRIMQEVRRPPRYFIRELTPSFGRRRIETGIDAEQVKDQGVGGQVADNEVHGDSEVGDAVEFDGR